jgi:diguanylate cyclase (GGDEF)-like protein
MADATRGEDLVARIGGDEFAWLMPETSDDSAREAVERLRTKIASRPFGNVGMVTFSAGISSISGTDDTETLVREADAALYAAKQAGRDTAVVHRTARPENPAAATSLIAS